MHLLVSEQYIDSILHGATMKAIGNRISFDFTGGKFEVVSGSNIEYGESDILKGNG